MWTYNGEVYDPSEQDLKQYVGFVYLLVEVDTNMKYIGKKFV